jgi:hypothetical protein
MSSNTTQAGTVRKNKSVLALNLFLGAAGVVLWWLIYQQLPAVSKWLTYGLLSISQGSHLGDSIEFFFMIRQKS